jgi:hypothetical protein
MTGGSGGTAGAGGTGGTAGAGGTVATGPITNTENADVSVTPFSVDAEPLSLVSSNLVYEPSAGEYYVQWFAVIRNDGPIALCHVQAEGSFEIGGLVVQETYGFADADAYLSQLEIPCIPPGGEGVVYDNGFVQTPPVLANIDKLTVVLEGADYGDQVPHPLAPTVSSATVVETYGAGTGFFSVQGSVLSTGTIYNIGMTVYPRSTSGLVIDQLMDHHLETFTTGSTWSYQTTSVEATFDEFHQYIDFLEGAEPAFSVIGTPEPSEQASLEHARRAALAERDEHRDQFAGKQ